MPEMGKAGTPYARSVQQTHPLPKHELPDSGLIFDTLLKRDGVSSVPFASAVQIVIAFLVRQAPGWTFFSDGKLLLCA